MTDVGTARKASSPVGRRFGAGAAAMAVVVGLAGLAGPAHADPVAQAPLDPAAPIACPAAVPATDIAAGMVGEGWTVVRGTEPQPFRVEVLGVLADGIGAGRDMVVIEVSDLPGYDVIGDHGIWAGMSGSPVYIGGQLLGAVSYGFTDSPSRIGGLTPATDMMKLLSLSSSASGAASVRAEARSAKTTVSLTPTQRKVFAGRASAALPGSTLDRLRTPVSVSGLSSRRLRSLQHEFDTAGRSVITYAGSRASSHATATATPQAGGNFAALATYGDLTVGGIGTTTAVCGDRALAFGHPMDFRGRSSFGAGDATSLAIITDTGLGSFKMANLGASFGTVDQDRLAGIRAKLGAGPTLVPIRTTIHNADTRASRTGTTQVAEPDYLAVATAYGIWANDDATFDRIGKGLATSSWRITGTRAGGRTFSVSRGNTWSSLSDPTEDPAIEAADAVDALTSNEFEPVKITSVSFDSTVSSAYQQLQVRGIAVSVKGGAFSSPSTVTVKAGQTIKVRVSLRGYQNIGNKNVVFSVKIPKKTTGSKGVISVRGGQSVADQLSQGSADGCLLTDCGEAQGSLDSVIRGLNAAPRNDLVMLRVAMNRPAKHPGAPIDLRSTASGAAPVSGSAQIAVRVKK